MNKKENYYNFIKEHFNVDLNAISSKEAKEYIENLNKSMDYLIEQENEKKQKLLNEYKEEKDKYIKLKMDCIIKG